MPQTDQPAASRIVRPPPSSTPSTREANAVDVSNLIRTSGAGALLGIGALLLATLSGCGSTAEVSDGGSSVSTGGGDMGLGGRGSSTGGSGGRIDLGGTGSSKGTGGDSTPDDPCESDHPPASCMLDYEPTGPGCGDGEVNAPGEECDDGNGLPGDGCSGVCTIEPNWTCDDDGCRSNIRCGDGQTSGGEVCDDGNTRDGDGCSSDCFTIEPGYDCPFSGGECEVHDPCTDPNPPLSCQPPPGSNPYCGDGVVNNVWEACDDGNTRPGDGCSGTCKVEPNWSCSSGTCVPTIVCGDGEVEGGEVCDDGNTGDGDGCSSDCFSITPGYECPSTGGACAEIDPCTRPNPPASCYPPPTGPTPTCGDGVRNQPTEQCDDGNTRPGDGCSGACRVEPNWNCSSGTCVSTIVCGDGRRQGTEVCDDGNHVSGDGCSDECRTVDPNYTCPPAGGNCVSTVVCGDGRIAGNEQCEDGNTTPNDGCTNCVRDPGFYCPTVGQSCQRVPTCGDGVQTANEECDDHNLDDDDGCNSVCRIEPGYSCPFPGQLCTQIVVSCGDGIISGDETCDDGNTDSDDGCSSLCRVETGWVCSVGGAACTPRCGDGLLVGNEVCDDGATEDGDGCSGSCKWEPGFHCQTTPPHDCVTDTCGNGLKGNDEDCDDGNRRPGDGCGVDCQAEPTCDYDAGGCTSFCGDGLVIDEECDDGNTVDGDGCSSTCEMETGFICEQVSGCAELAGWNHDNIDGTPTVPTCIMRVPVTYRDFDESHPDFEPAENSVVITGLVAARLDAQGKPVFVGTPNQCGQNQSCIQSPSSFASWFRDDPSVNTPVIGEILLWDNGSGGFVNRWGQNGERYMRAGNPGTLASETCGNRWSCSEGQTPTDACTCNGGHPWNAACNPANGAHLRCFAKINDGANQPEVPFGTPGIQYWYAEFLQGYVPEQAWDGDPAFFPLDGLGRTPTNQYHAADFPSLYGGGPEGGGAHNFHFTSEIRRWFQYEAGRSYALEFTGDDDVWVFINGRLAVDLGSYHEAANGSIRIEPNGAVTVVNHGVTAPATTVSSLGLTSGNIYEIAVFQAERKFVASSYRLTLSGFNENPSVCHSVCGDGVVASDEECDDGENDGGYGECQPGCVLGARCGDGQQNDASEECDNGSNIDGYNASAETACGPGCVKPARCGDGIVDFVHGEVCDRGAENSDTAYGGCNTSCQLGARCGDGEVNGDEECDDGVNDGTQGCGPTCEVTAGCGDGIQQGDELCDDGENDGGYGECAPGCVPAPYCGDGAVDALFGETCDDGVNDGSYGGCTPSCQMAAHCGDGVVSGDELCDDGENDGGYGECAPGCVPAPYCGDGRPDTEFGEACDDGVNDGGYGECQPGCVYGPMCGDGVVDPGEECDDGVNDGGYGECAPGCMWGARCGDGQTQPNEECDDGVNAGGYGECAPNCKSGPFCGDGQRQGNEVCDDGVNDGRYGSCAPGCQQGAFCGDGIVQPEEQCDDGVNDGTRSACQPGCVLGPGCGDGILQRDLGEACDDGVNDGGYGECAPECKLGARCGDGQVQSQYEQCDDGVNAGGYGKCAPNCRIGPHCGDGQVNGNEICDDGVNAGGYGKCAPGCKLGPYCGDGVVQGPEEACDDGNRRNGDGCSATCRKEIIK